jgi:hypothetical protein
MPITAAQYEARIVELRASLEKLRADAIATDGAIQDCQYWLAELTKELTRESTDVRDPDRHE